MAAACHASSSQGRVCFTEGSPVVGPPSSLGPLQTRSGPWTLQTDVSTIPRGRCHRIGRVAVASTTRSHEPSCRGHPAAPSNRIIQGCAPTPAAPSPSTRRLRLLCITPPSLDSAHAEHDHQHHQHPQHHHHRRRRHPRCRQALHPRDRCEHTASGHGAPARRLAAQC